MKDELKRVFAPVFVTVAVLTLLVLTPELAYAYGGPGSIISGIGALLAALAAIAAAIFGFFWFPLKRLARKLRGEEEKGEVDSEARRELASE